MVGTRFVSLYASTVIAFLVSIGNVRADLLISNYEHGFTGSIRRVNETTKAVIPPDPFINLGGGGGEGVACLTIDGRAVYYIANNTGKIKIYDQISGNFIKDLVDLGASAHVAALSLSLDASLIYAADPGTFHILALDTANGNTMYSVSTVNSHDVVVGPDGTVYGSH
jgi:hypothetical protein